MSAADGPQEARGVHNPRVVDLVTEDDATGEVVLVMLEARPWGSDVEQIRQLEAKFNAYLEYVLGVTARAADSSQLERNLAVEMGMSSV